MFDDRPLVCQPAAMSRFSDDARGACAICGCAVAYRPYLPEEAPKLCVSCHDGRRARGRRR
ncbi:MAG TPA: hypothetical protein VIL72_01685 [Beijerinckiaceae bacterium]